MDLRQKTFLFLDCQTTGMHPALGQILEVAWCLTSLESSEPQIESRLIELEEGSYLPKRVRDVTGIRPYDLKDAKPAVDVRLELLELISKFKPATSLIHYAQFEKAFLLPFLCDASETHLPFEVICTQALSKRLLPQVPSRNVRALSGFFGAHLPEVKRASQHVKATIEIWRGLAAELEKQNIRTLEELTLFISAPAPKKKKESTGVKSVKYEYLVDRKKRLALPNRPGVYKMIAKNGEILYVGKATSLKDRVNSYFRGKRGRDARKLEMMAQTWDLDVIECKTALEAALLEADEIKKHDPPYNVSLKESYRRLYFYNRDFSERSEIQDSDFAFGPFGPMNAIEEMRKVLTWKQTGEIADLFHGTVEDPLLIEEGYKLFRLEQTNREPKTMRESLALALHLLRKEKASQTETETENQEPPQLETGTQTQTESDLPLDPPAIAAKFHRLYLRAARAWLRSKKLTSLLNTDVRWQENGTWYELQIRGGKISDSCSEGVKKTVSPWFSLGIADYDRMSVLLTGLNKESEPV